MFRSSSLSIISVCSRDSVQGIRGLRVLDYHQAKHVIDSDFGRLPSGGHHHIISSSGSGAGFCRKIDEEETGTVLVNSDCRHQPWSGENRRIFDFQVEHLSRASVVNKKYHQRFSTNRHSKFMSGVQNPNQGLARVDNVVGATFKVEILLGLSSEFQPEGNRGSGERSREMSTTFFTNWTDGSCIQNFAIFAQNVKV